MNQYLLISDAAKEVKVESHVLRYWEEELHLPIKRNELGHRYYTEEDVERFKQIKSMKERGLQLKAIKMILKNGKLDVIEPPVASAREKDSMPIQIVDSREMAEEIVPESKEDKSKRLQWLLQQLIRETLRENNQDLCREIKETVLKEMDYQFRLQEEREDERERIQMQRGEEYYKKMDELLRRKSKNSLMGRVKDNTAKDKTNSEKSENTKKKRHSIF